MIVLLEQTGERAVFDNVTSIEEKGKSSVIGSRKKVVNLYNGEDILVGGDDIDLTFVTLTILPNAESE